jgi:hypothetical protein
MRISWSFIACGGKGGGVAIAVGESIPATGEAFADAGTVGASVGAVVGDAVGSGEGDSVGAGVWVSTGSSTVPMMGLSKSSASERGVTIKTQRIRRATIAFLIVDSGFLAMLARVMMMQRIALFGRVLPEQTGL